MAQRESFGESSGGPPDKRAHGDLELRSPPPAERKRGGGRSQDQGKVTFQYHGRVEHYAYVTESDLREAVEFGFLHQVLIQSGTFFFSGAFWLLTELVIKQTEISPSFKITPWMGVCGLSMLFGSVLNFAGWRLYVAKQKKLEKYFPKPTVG